jgi:hypothetical protein
MAHKRPPPPVRNWQERVQCPHCGTLVGKNGFVLSAGKKAHAACAKRQAKIDAELRQYGL